MSFFDMFGPMFDPEGGSNRAGRQNPRKPSNDDPIILNVETDGGDGPQPSSNVPPKRPSGPRITSKPNRPRKPSNARDYEKIAREIRETEPVEAVLNGINLSAYRYNGKNLTDLLYYLKDVPCRIRLGSLEVNIIDDAFLLACQSLNDFAPHFHLSLQSGSDAVLKKMNRHYTAEEYLEKVKLIRSYFPDAAITTDIIAGFPTETEENFEETLAFVRRVRFSAIHCFPFSARSGTVAGRMKDLPMSVKKERVERLLAEGKAGHEAFIAENLNTVQEFIPETETNGFWAGYTGNYIRVYVENCKAGGRYRVRLTGRFRDGALAEIIK